MTLQVKEVALSRRFSTDETGKRRAQRVFIAFNDTIGGTVTLNGALFHPTMPKKFQAHPEDSTIKASHYEVRPITTKTSYVYEFTWHYQFLSPPIDQGGPPKVPADFVEQGLTIEAIWVDTWRVDHPPAFSIINPPVNPANGQWQGDVPTGVQADDIDGMAVDSKGEPVSRALHIGILTFKVFVSDIASQWPIWYTLLNHRNNAPFAGLAPGTVVYKGANGVRVSEDLWEVTHEFAFDGLYHARQQCWHVQPGRPQVGVGSDGFAAPSDYENYGYPVVWVQPYPRVGNFSILQIPTG